jgi:hypothetical protein
MMKPLITLLMNKLWDQILQLDKNRELPPRAERGDRLNSIALNPISCLGFYKFDSFYTHAPYKGPRIDLFDSMHEDDNWVVMIVLHDDYLLDYVLLDPRNPDCVANNAPSISAEMRLEVYAFNPKCKHSPHYENSFFLRPIEVTTTCNY